MNYQVLSRKHRPQNFEEIKGQDHIVETLLGSINLDRIAHGYLLSGLRGVGKTTTARVFSKTINCLNLYNSKPCESCHNCIEIKESRSLDVIELDGASNRGIDEIREIKETVKYPPIKCKYKVFIIDEVHMLTKEAFNALLKTLEEPPDNVIFILATTDSFKIPDTILSRVLRFDFKKVSNEDIFNHLKDILKKENITYEIEALEAITLKAEGSIRDSLSILDRIISYSQSNVSYKLVKESLGIIEDKTYLHLLNYISINNTNKLLVEVREIINSGYQMANFISGFNIFLSNCLIYISGYKDNKAMKDITKEWLDKNNLKIDNIYFMRIIDEIQKFELKSKNLLQPDIAFESLLIKLCMIEETIQISDLLLDISRKEIESSTDVIKKEGEPSGENISKRIESSTDKIKNESQSPSSITKKENVHSTDLINNEAEDKSHSIKITEEDKSFLTKKWQTLIDNIEEEDKRISSFLEGSLPAIKEKNIIIELDKDSNSFAKNILTKNIDLIKEKIKNILDKDFDVIIKNNSSQKINDDKEHPLFEKIKEKFENN